MPTQGGIRRAGGVTNPNLLLVFVCLGVGACLRWTGRFPKNFPHSINSFVIWVSLPALILNQIPPLWATMHWGPDLFVPVSMAWLLFPLSFFFFSLIGKIFRWDRAEIGALVLTAGLSNTSFVGYPLLEAFAGSGAVRIGLLVDQPGTFLVLSTLGLITASAMSPHEAGRITVTRIVKNILTFPPFIALLLALAWVWWGIFPAGSLVSVLDRLSGTLIPLALVAVGFQLRLSRVVIRRHWRPLFLGLSFKLILVPVFFWILYTKIFLEHGFSVQVTILESAMAPMITAGIVAEEFGFNPELANLMIGVGIPISIVTVFLWSRWLPLH
ncbi:MAG: AEC family transporter [Bdellovibrionales bacterium]|nr:AEC family transporter [Bdellovibrionales bacterium]